MVGDPQRSMPTPPVDCLKLVDKYTGSSRMYGTPRKYLLRSFGDSRLNPGGR